MITLIDVLSGIPSFISNSFFSDNKRLFQPEHLVSLSSRLTLFHIEGIPELHPLPYFHAECTPPLNSAYRYFEQPMKRVSAITNDKADLIQMFANAFEEAGIGHILILMGQRLTPGSYNDSRAIPPFREELIKSASETFNTSLTTAAREWTKHTNRSKDKFWGEIKGNDQYKNQQAIGFIKNILDNATWWNIFGHFKHETIFEARVPSGHSARWGYDGGIL